MSIFRKNQRPDKQSIAKKEENRDEKHSGGEPKKVKKKMKIGFGHKQKNEQPVVNSKACEATPLEEDESPLPKEPTTNPGTPETSKEIEQMDVFFDDLTPIKENKSEEHPKSEKKEEEWSASKRKAFHQKDMKGKPVFLEDTGEKLGIVFDTLRDGEKNLLGYKIKDSKSDSVLSFPLDQFDEDKNGLIFIPSWYTKGTKTIEQLEFKDRITPELKWLITDNTISTEELYEIFVKHDDKIANYIKEAVSIRELLSHRLHILEKERKSLKETLMDLTEKRLIADIDRREFSEIVMQHRQKVTVLDINIKKCKTLLDRLQQTSFGLLSMTMISTHEREEQEQPSSGTSFERNSIKKKENRVEELYREKYLNLKDRYDSLQDGYNELKIAVEKLLGKNEP